jgi:hypothetical protein
MELGSGIVIIALSRFMGNITESILKVNQEKGQKFRFPYHFPQMQHKKGFYSPKSKSGYPGIIINLNYNH